MIGFFVCLYSLNTVTKPLIIEIDKKLSDVYQYHFYEYGIPINFIFIVFFFEDVWDFGMWTL